MRERESETTEMKQKRTYAQWRLAWMGASNLVSTNFILLFFVFSAVVNFELNYTMRKMRGLPRLINVEHWPAILTQSRWKWETPEQFIWSWKDNDLMTTAFSLSLFLSHSRKHVCASIVLNHIIIGALNLPFYLSGTKLSRSLKSKIVFFFTLSVREINGAAWPISLTLTHNLIPIPKLNTNQSVGKEVKFQ